MQANRRELIAAFTILGLSPAMATRLAAQTRAALGSAQPFSWTALQTRAEQLARQPYKPQAKVEAAAAIAADGHACRADR